MRTIALVTGARSDWGIYTSIIRALKRRSDVHVQVVVTGMHLSSAAGRSGTAVEQAGVGKLIYVETQLAGDSPAAISKSLGLGVVGFADLFANWTPDILLLLGDRYEMYAAAVAALPFLIPVAHVHGGELTAGAIDDALRHSLTKLSHLHFASIPEYGRRIIQLGEENWRVHVCGAPALDGIKEEQLASREELGEWLGRALPERFLLITFHSVTLDYKRAEFQIRELIEAVKGSGLCGFFTLPNADTGNDVIRQVILTEAKRQNWLVADNLGRLRYFSVMRLATAMVGNSSSGIIEAASFALPVVNVGDRQKGRFKPDNVIDSGYDGGQIGAAISIAISDAFKEKCRKATNPYYTGSAGTQIAERLATIELNEPLLQKKFIDQE